MLNRKSRVALVSIAAVALGAGVLSVQPVRAAIDAVMSCSASTACLQWTNTSSGNAVKGISNQGNAVLGKTEYESAGQSVGKAGVLGQDASTSGNLDFGVQGTSTNGTGVYGLTSSSTGSAGVSGVNNATAHNANSVGVYANGGSFNDGIHSFANSGNAVYAFSQSGTPLLANQGANTRAPELYLQDSTSSLNKIIQAFGPSGDVFDVMPSGAVVTAGSVTVGGSVFSSGSTTSTGALEGENGVTALQGSASQSILAEGSGVFFDGFDTNTSEETVEILSIGDISITGLLFTNGSCSSGCIAGGKRVRSLTEYAPVETEPTIEDNGEGSLSNGVAYISFDARFASAIDPTAEYFVTVTPEGDCRGLYVAQRSPAGFTVRELQGGHSTLQFYYRVVAKRYGVSGARLPMTAVRHSDSVR